MNSNLRKSIVGNSVLQRRKSYDLGRRSSISELPGSGRLSNPKPRRSSSEERKSGVNFGFHGRRSSLFNENKGQMKDLRPLKEKAYQKKKVAEIVEFLKSEGYPHSISESRMMQPSKKDFEMIFQFLINFFNVNYVVKRIEDEAPKILNELCYPFVPNKSAFQYVAKTNFPSLLGVLIFLMDVYRSIKDFDVSLFMKTGSEEQMVLLEFITSCYYTRDVTDSQIQESMAEMIKQYRLGYDYDELCEKNSILKTRLKDVETKLANYEHLKMVAEQQQGNIKKYKDFFAQIKDRKQKKEEACEKLAEILAVKEKERDELNALCIEKEKAYDAQGFDGKKQISFYESQMKELKAKLQAKQELRKNVQNKCWDAEMLYTQTTEKGSSTCESFNELYSKVQDSADRLFNLLKDVKDPQVKALSSNLRVEFPRYNMTQGVQNLMTQGPAVQSKLEDIKQKIDCTNACLKTIKAKQKEDLAASEMEVSRLTLGIKVATAQNKKVEMELLAKEKEAKERWQEFETKYDEGMQKIDKIMKEKMDADEKNKKLTEELMTVEKIKNEKQKMFDEYLKAQKELFQQLDEKLERRRKMVEENGELVHQALRKSMN